MTQHQSIFLTLIIAFAVIFGGVAIAAIYSGNNAPITVTNNNDPAQTVYNTQLVSYGDSLYTSSSGLITDSCFDSDNGMYPLTAGISTWQDGVQPNQQVYAYYDQCESGTNQLLELACARHVKIGGTQYNNYATVMRFDCTSIGLQCQSTPGVGARCV